MHIRKITIENIRAIERLSLDFAGDRATAPRRVILVGPNGAGKTTILMAIAHVFGRARSDHQVPHLGVKDVRRVNVGADVESNQTSAAGVIALEVALSDEERASIKANFPDIPDRGLMRFEFGRVWVSRPVGVGGARVWPTQEDVFRDAATMALDRYRAAPCVLLPTNRGTLTDNEDVTVRSLDPDHWESSAVDLAPKRFAPLAARLALAATGAKVVDLEKRSARLWKVTEKYFPELPRPEAVRGLRLVFRNREGTLVTLDEMSDGERAVLLVLAEVALRAAPEAVVLVDEIEQHLHPRWQRAIIEALPALLPGGQFFFTTQAPYVAASAPDDCFKIGDWGNDGT